MLTPPAPQQWPGRQSSPPSGPSLAASRAASRGPSRASSRVSSRGAQSSHRARPPGPSALLSLPSAAAPIEERALERPYWPTDLTASRTAEIEELRQTSRGKSSRSRHGARLDSSTRGGTADLDVELALGRFGSHLMMKSADDHADSLTAPEAQVMKARMVEIRKEARLVSTMSLPALRLKQDIERRHR